jgi:prepilin-type N-terminal cleavage/methylation domain-containing protein
MISTLKKLQAKKAVQEKSGGFTLIELLIVIVVLGILAAVVVFSLGGVTGTSAQAACTADGSSINTALAAFGAQNLTYPAVGGETPNTGTTYSVGTSLIGPTAELATWPNNSSHYTFSLSYDTTNGEQIWVKSTSAATKDPVLTGTETFPSAGDFSGWTQWSNSTSCKTAGVK